MSAIRVTLRKQCANMVMLRHRGCSIRKLALESKHSTVSGVKLKDEKIVGNYCISLTNQFPEFCLYFDVQRTINFEEMKNLARVSNLPKISRKRK